MSIYTHSPALYLVWIDQSWTAVCGPVMTIVGQNLWDSLKQEALQTWAVCWIQSLGYKLKARLITQFTLVRHSFLLTTWLSFHGFPSLSISSPYTHTHTHIVLCGKMNVHWVLQRTNSEPWPHNQNRLIQLSSRCKTKDRSWFMRKPFDGSPILNWIDFYFLLEWN